MTEEAERFKDDDKKKRDLVESRNHAEALIHSTEKSVKDLGDKVSADDKAKIEAAIKALKETSSADDVEAIKAKTNELTQAAMKLGEALYGGQQAGAAGAAPGGQPGGAKSGENVVDADFEEVKDDKKKSA